MGSLEEAVNDMKNQAAGTAPIVPGAVAQPAPVATPIVQGTPPALPAQSAPIVQGATDEAAVNAASQPAITDLGGGSRLNSAVDEAMRTARTGSGRNNMPFGTGIFLLKSGKFGITEVKKAWRTLFSFVCLQGGIDSNGLSFGTEGYSGSIPGAEYAEPMWQDITGIYAKQTIEKNLTALRVCLGWTEAKMLEYQGTPEGLRKLYVLLSGLFCLDMQTTVPTNQPCLFSNQVVVELTRRDEPYDAKVDGKKVMDADSGQILKKIAKKLYWNNHIPLVEVSKLINNDAVLTDAFGSEEIFLAAVKSQMALQAQF